MATGRGVTYLCVAVVTRTAADRAAADRVAADTRAMVDSITLRR